MRLAVVALQLIVECLFEHKSRNFVTVVRRRLKSIGARKRSLRKQGRSSRSELHRRMQRTERTGIEPTNVNFVAATLGGGSLQRCDGTNPLYRGKGVKSREYTAVLAEECPTTQSSGSHHWRRLARQLQFGPGCLTKQARGFTCIMKRRERASGRKTGNRGAKGVRRHGRQMCNWANAEAKRYSKFTTDDGHDYFVPETGKKARLCGACRRAQTLCPQARTAHVQLGQRGSQNGIQSLQLTMGTITLYLRRGKKARLCGACRRGADIVPASTDGACATGPTRKPKRYSKFTTDDGHDYFVPEAGEEGETLWCLPEGADIVPASADVNYTKTC